MMLDLFALLIGYPATLAAVAAITTAAVNFLRQLGEVIA